MADQQVPVPGGSAPGALFADPAGPALPPAPGLQLLTGFLTPEQQAIAVQRVDAAAEEWRNDLARRVQHYGWRYDYKARLITPDLYLGRLPEWLQSLADRLYQETGAFDRPPEQVIVNEYQTGQGIGIHIDHRGFGPAIATISLLDDWSMDFSPNWKDRTAALLPRGSCLLLTGAARSQWQHAIEPKQSEQTPGGLRRRQRRVSLTFRTVLNQDGMND